MKNLAKIFAVFTFIISVFACQDGKMDEVENPGNKHDNARTNAVIDVSGTMTLNYPGYDYDLIRPAAGTYLTLGNGVRFNSFDWSNLGGGTATIHVPSGSTIQSFASFLVPAGVDFIIDGRSYNYALINVTGGNINNAGEHYPSGGLRMSAGNYTQGLTAITTGAQLYGSGGKFTFSTAWSRATFNNVYINGTGTALVWGAGRMTFTNGGEVWLANLTGSSTTRICLTGTSITYYASATLGPGSYSCP